MAVWAALFTSPVLRPRPTGIEAIQLEVAIRVTDDVPDDHSSIRLNCCNMLRAYFSSTPGFGPAAYDSRAGFGLSDANPCSLARGVCRVRRGAARDRERPFGRYASSARAALLGALACCAIAVRAGEAAAPSQAPLKPIVVIGKKSAPEVPDAVLKEQVETTMHTDPYFFDAHVTVTVKDGVVILEGLVFDAWDIVTATRIARKIPGVKRVFNDIELADSGD
jgi:hypothetical protein